MGDATAAQFSEFVRYRTPALLRTAFLLTGDRHLAEDLVQDALARTHRAARRLGDDGHFEAYTRTAMYHLHVSRWRRRRFTETLPGELADRVHPDGDHADRTDLKLALHEALGRLTRRQRAVLVLRYFEDRSEAEAAQLLSCSVGTIKSQTSKALARLRQIAPDLLAPAPTEGAAR
jgi:RNA polymerase sigma-70 factor (sigma-E family)